ncbi:MAG: polyprenol monophosphomannose synthase [Vulcanisaeta sp.]
MDVCVVLPTINEADNLRVLLPRLSEVLSGYDWFVVVVDDGSTDGTQDVVYEFSRSTNKALLIERGVRLGLGSAIRTGMKACIDKGADTIVVMDADLQHPPEVVPSLVNAVLNGYDLAIASRYTNGGGVAGWSFTRLMISKGATYMARLLMPWVRSIRDPVSGFFAIRGDRLRGLIDSLSDSAGYKLILELLTVAHVAYGSSFKVAEIPYVFRSRAYGKSKLNSKELMNYAQLVLKLSNYSVFKYLLSLIIGSLVGYAIFHALSSMNALLGNVLSLELSLITVITLYQVLMGIKPRFRNYINYHAVKYTIVMIKLLLFEASIPVLVVLIISAVAQLILTLRIIQISPIEIHVIHA